MKTEPFKPNWNLYALALIGLMFFYQLIQWPLLPKFVDIYYHLGVVKGFADAGGWVARDTWEFAPGGQPHLYPPFLHFLLLIPYKLGLDAISLARLADILSYPALLVSFWIFVRQKTEERTAFAALFLFSTVYSALLASVTLPAFNLAMIGCLWTLHSWGRGKVMAAALIAAAVCYTHVMAAGMLAGMIVLGALFDPSLRKSAWRVFVPAAFLSSPMWGWLLTQRQAFTLIAVSESTRIEFDPFLYGLAAWRVVRSLKTKKFDVWPLVIFLSLAPAIPFRQARVIGGYGLMAASWLAANELLSWVDALSVKRGRKAAAGLAVGLALFFGLAAPSCLWNPQTGHFRATFGDRTLSRFMAADAPVFQAKGFSIYFEKEYRQILDVVEARLGPDELFWTDFPHAGGILTLLSGRAMTTSMLGEVGAWEDRKTRLENAKLLIWFKDAQGRATGDAPEMIRALGLTPVADTDLAFIFENPSSRARAQRPQAVLPLTLIWPLMALWVVALSVYLKH